MFIFEVKSVSWKRMSAPNFYECVDESTQGLETFTEGNSFIQQIFTLYLLSLSHSWDLGIQ